MTTKFTMDSRELKGMIDKAMSTIGKSSIEAFRKIYFDVENDGEVRVLGTNMENFVEVRSRCTLDASAGRIGIDMDDIKMIGKMNGDVTISHEEGAERADVSCGKKMLTIPCFEAKEEESVTMPKAGKKNEHILTLKEHWLLETITNLLPFVKDVDGRNPGIAAFSFDTEMGAVYACDSYRIGSRKIPDGCIENVITGLDTLRLPITCVPVLKKILDKKSEDRVRIYRDKEYVRIEGENFTFATRRMNNLYFNIKNCIEHKEDYRYKFRANKEDMISVMKYYCDVAGKDREPVLFHNHNGELCTYMKTNKYELFESIEVDDFYMHDDEYVGFNPHFILDAFNTVDSDEPLCEGLGRKTPLFIYGEEYSFMMLPVHINDRVPCMENFINKKIGVA